MTIPRTCRRAGAASITSALANCDAGVQVVDGKTQLLSQVQHVGQTAVDILSVGIAAVVIGINAWDSDTALQTADQFLFAAFHQFL